MPTHATNATGQIFFFFKLLPQLLWLEGLDQTLTELRFPWGGATFVRKVMETCSRDAQMVMHTQMSWGLLKCTPTQQRPRFAFPTPLREACCLPGEYTWSDGILEGAEGRPMS